MSEPLTCVVTAAVFWQLSSNQWHAGLVGTMAWQCGQIQAGSASATAGRWSWHALARGSEIGSKSPNLGLCSTNQIAHACWDGTLGITWGWFSPTFRLRRDKGVSG
eukprot:scaffold40880_cov21-Phaeocystis_antarctica.AAC.1